jgi:hypothetical protein
VMGFTASTGKRVGAREAEYCFTRLTARQAA